jgi:hypothetical protein
MSESFTGNLDAAQQVARVKVKSAWLSKINWTQAVALLASLLALKGFDLDADTQLAIVAAIQGAQSAVTWALRTFFNRSVNPASL